MHHVKCQLSNMLIIINICDFLSLYFHSKSKTNTLSTPKPKSQIKTKLFSVLYNVIISYFLLQCSFFNWKQTPNFGYI